MAAAGQRIAVAIINYIGRSQLEAAFSRRAATMIEVTRAKVRLERERFDLEAPAAPM